METFLKLTDTLFQESATDFKHHPFTENSHSTVIEEDLENQQNSPKEINESDSDQAANHVNKNSADEKLKQTIKRLQETLDDIRNVYLFGRRTSSFVIEGINEHEKGESLFNQQVMKAIDRKLSARWRGTHDDLPEKGPGVFCR